MASNYVQLNWLEPAWDDEQFGALSSLERRQRKAAEKQDVHAFYSSLKFVFFIIAAVLVWSEANAIMTDASRALTGAFVLEVWKSAGVAYAQLQLLYKQVGELAWTWNAVVYGHDFAQRGGFGLVVLLLVPCVTDRKRWRAAARHSINFGAWVTDLGVPIWPATGKLANPVARLYHLTTLLYGKWGVFVIMLIMQVLVHGLSITHGVAKLLETGLLYLAVLLSGMLLYITLSRPGHAPLRTVTLSTLAAALLIGAPPLYAVVIARLCNGCSPEPVVLLALLFAALMLTSSIGMSRRITGRPTGDSRAGGGPQAVTQGGGPGGGARGGNSRSTSSGGPVRRGSQGTSTAAGGGGGSSGGGGGSSGGVGGGGGAATTAGSGGGGAGAGAAGPNSSNNKRSTAPTIQLGRSRGGGGGGGAGAAAGDVTAHVSASGRSSSAASLTCTTAFSSARNSGAYGSGGGVNGAVSGFDPAVASSVAPFASSGDRGGGGGLTGSSRTASAASSFSYGMYDPTIVINGSGNDGQPSVGGSRHGGGRTATSSCSTGPGPVSAATHGPSSHSLSYSLHSGGAPNSKGASAGGFTGTSSTSSVHASPTLIDPLVPARRSGGGGGLTLRGGGGSATGGISSSASQPGSGGGVGVNSVLRTSTGAVGAGAASKQPQQSRSGPAIACGGGDGGSSGSSRSGGGGGGAANGKQSSAPSPGILHSSLGLNESTTVPGVGGGGKGAPSELVVQGSSQAGAASGTTKSAALYDLVTAPSGPASKRKGGAGGVFVVQPPVAPPSAAMPQSVSNAGGGVSNCVVGGGASSTLYSGGSASVTHRSTTSAVVAGPGVSTTTVVAANGTARTTRATDASVSKAGAIAANGVKGSGAGSGGDGSAVPATITSSLPSLTATGATATAGSSNAANTDGGTIGSRLLTTTLTTTAGGSTYTLVGATGSTNAAAVTLPAAASHSPSSVPRVTKKATGPATTSVVTAIRKPAGPPGSTSSPQYLLISPSVPPLPPPPPPPRRSPTKAETAAAVAPLGGGSPLQQPPAVGPSPSEAAPVRNAWLKPNPVIKLAVGVAKGPRGATATATAAATRSTTSNVTTGANTLAAAAVTNAQVSRSSGGALFPDADSAPPNTQPLPPPPPLVLPSVRSASYGGATGAVVEPLTVLSCDGGVTSADPPVLSARSPGSVSSGGTGFLSAIGDPVAPSPLPLSSSSSLSGGGSGVFSMTALTQAIGVSHGSVVTAPSSSPSPSPIIVTTSTLSPHAQPYYLPDAIHRTAGVTSHLLSATIHSADHTNQFVPIVAHKHASGDLEIAAVAANYQPYPSTAPAHQAFGNIHAITAQVAAAVPSAASCEADAESFSFFSIPPPVILDSTATGVSPTDTDTLLASASPLSYRGYGGTSGFPFGPDPVWSPNVPSTIFAPPSPALGAAATAGRTARVPPPGFPSHAYGGAFAAGPIPGVGAWAPPQPHHPSKHVQPAAVIAPAPGVAGATAPAPSRDTLPLPPATESGVLASLGFVEDGADISSGAGDDTAGGSCAICWSAPRQVGFLHGKTSHLCVCRDCAVHLREGVHRCPMCRQLIERIIDIF